MTQAIAYFEELGAEDIRDVSASRPYDLEVLLNGITVTVEVKGTVGDGREILLTRGEVEHHIQAAPRNALVVVRGIRLEGDANAPKAAGGQRQVVAPWLVDRERLSPLAYRYSMGDDLSDSTTAATGANALP